MKIKSGEFSKALGISLASFYKRADAGLLPEPIQHRPLAWDTESEAFKKWSKYHPASKEGRKLYASAGEFARQLRITKQAFSQRCNYGSIPPFDFEILGERLWLWALIHPYINRRLAEANNWVEDPPDIGSQTAMPYRGEKCVGIKNRLGEQRQCNREAVFFFGPDIKPSCGVCGIGKQKAMRTIDNEVQQKYMAAFEGYEKVQSA